MSITPGEAKEYAAAILATSDSAKVNAIISAVEREQRRVRAGGADVMAALTSVIGQHLAAIEAGGGKADEVAAGAAMAIGMAKEAAGEAIRRNLRGGGP